MTLRLLLISSVLGLVVADFASQDLMRQIRNRNYLDADRSGFADRAESYSLPSSSDQRQQYYGRPLADANQARSRYDLLRDEEVDDGYIFADRFDLKREDPRQADRQRPARRPEDSRYPYGDYAIADESQRPAPATEGAAKPRRIKVPRNPVRRTSSATTTQAEPKAYTEDYKPASGPAYATASNIDELRSAQPRFDPIPYPSTHSGGLDEPAEQRSIQQAVLAEANSYQPDGVYQKEDRLEFQIHGHQGPHSYRYGYDTGHGYNRQFRYEERDQNGYVKGRYGFFDKYGKLQIVNYSADPYKGFHAEGAHVPHYPH